VVILFLCELVWETLKGICRIEHGLL